jgi:hypothetical protein
MAFVKRVNFLVMIFELFFKKRLIEMKRTEGQSTWRGEGNSCEVGKNWIEEYTSRVSWDNKSSEKVWKGNKLICNVKSIINITEQGGGI